MATSPLADRESWVPGVSPWTRILPHYLSLAASADWENTFGGIRNFVVLAVENPCLAGRYVWPSTINMSLFLNSEEVDYAQKPMAARFVISCRDRDQVRLRFILGGDAEPTLDQCLKAADAIAQINELLNSFELKKSAQPDAIAP